MNEYDVVVVGGRVAGASTALLLARAGVRVVLVDRDRHGSDTVSTHGLMRAGVVQLASWGVLPDVAAADTPPIRQVVFHYADGEPVSVEIKPSAGVEALYAPRRHLLDRLIVDAATAAGVEVLHETIARQCSLGTPDAMNSPPSPRTNAHGIGYPRHDQRHRGSRRVRLEPGSSTPPAPRGQLGDGRGN